MASAAVDGDVQWVALTDDELHSLYCRSTVVPWRRKQIDCGEHGRPDSHSPISPVYRRVCRRRRYYDENGKIGK
jgi:hypothetical protein